MRVWPRVIWVWSRTVLGLTVGVNVDVDVDMNVDWGRRGYEFFPLRLFVCSCPSHTIPSPSIDMCEMKKICSIHILNLVRCQWQARAVARSFVSTERDRFHLRA